MQKLKICMLVMFICSSFLILGCGGHHEEESIAPIHLDMDTSNIQSRVGLSGYIFGNFMLINAYLIILLSCVILIVKEDTFKKIADTLRMGIQMLNPTQQQDGAALKALGLLSDGEARFRVGSVGLIAGLIIGYLGAWIAT